MRAVEVADPAGLAALLQDAVRSHRKSDRAAGRRTSDRAVARSVGLHESQLFRVRHQEYGSLSRDVVAKLEKLVAEKDRPRFWATLVMPEARDSLVLYRLWLMNQFRDGTQREGWRGVRDLKGAMRWIDGESAAGRWGRAKDRARLTARLRKVLGRDPLKVLLTATLSFTTDRELALMRAFVAWTRIVAPLLESPESGFIEPDGSELPAPDLREFVEMGLKRELKLLALLEREGVLGRARTAARRSDPRLPVVAAPLPGKAASRLRRHPGQLALRELAIGHSRRSRDQARTLAEAQFPDAEDDDERRERLGRRRDASRSPSVILVKKRRGRKHGARR